MVKIRLRKPIKHASHERTETDNVVVECRLSDGSVGYGEGVPRDYVTGETAASALAALKSVDWNRQLRPVASFAAAVQCVRAIEIPLAPD
ncbi:MAG: dipeptide epimerase, partial [Planctomycetia bacterium]